MAVENDSYCAEADVVAITQYETDFDGSSTPTETQLLEFMARRAGELYAILYDVMGTAAPGPAAYSVTVDTSTDGGKALDAVLKQQNSIGASFDVLSAAGAGESPARSERIAELWTMWVDGNAALRNTATMYVASTSGTSTSATHISTGEITEKSVTSREEDGLTFNGSTQW